LIVHAKRGQAAVDEENNAGFTRPWSIVARNDAGTDGFNLLGFLGGEEFELRRRSRLRGMVRVGSSGKETRPVRGNPDGGKSSGPLG